MDKSLGMTVEDLIEYLKDFDPNTPVAIRVPAKDYWNTTLASPVRDGPVEEMASFSDYHRDWALPKHEPEDDDYDNFTRICLIG